MVDRSSRPHRSPRRTPTRTERRIVKVRVLRRWGPARIGYLLGIHPSTVHRVLTRYGLAKLRWLDRPTGHVVRRMEPARCGDMVHVDVEKLGEIPAGGGWRMLGRTTGNRNTRADKTSLTQQARSAPTRSPLPTHRHRRSLAAGLQRAAGRRAQGHRSRVLDPRQRLVHQCGITVRKVLTDNGSCYRSFAFRDALGDAEHRRTRPYRPQTNGKVERFHRTLADEWAYARLYRSDAERCTEFPIWLHTYNCHRGHTALGGQPPSTRVPNLSGQYS